MQIVSKTDRSDQLPQIGRERVSMAIPGTQPSEIQREALQTCRNEAFSQPPKTAAHVTFEYKTPTDRLFSGSP